MLLHSWSLYFVGLALLCLLDLALVLWRADVGAAGAARYAASAVAAAGWVAFLLAAALTLLTLPGRLLCRLRGPPGARGRLLGASAWGAVFAAGCYLLLKPWTLFSAIVWLPYAALLGGFAGGAVLLLLHRALGARLFGALALLGAAAAFVLDAFVLRRLYLTFHNAAAFAAVQAAMLAALICFPRERRRALVLATLVVAAAAHLVLLAELSPARFVGVRHGTLQPKLFALLHGAVDLDGDGHAALLGGGDCDDLDGEVHPERCEVPGNGVDDNCNGSIDPSPPRRRGTSRQLRSLLPDVYLVLADAMRADAGVSRRELTPAIDSLAARSLDFTRAYTPFPSTFGAVSAMTRSRYWRYVGQQDPSLLELLEPHGYQAEIWVHRRRVVKARGARLLRLEWRGNPFSVPAGAKERWTAEIVDRAIAELQSTEPTAPPRLRWLHLLDPHGPWRRGSPDAPGVTRYRAELRHVDREVGRLLTALQRTPRGRRAVFVFIADHGTAFGEHGSYHHASTLYDELTRVPMILHLPGVPPRRVDQLASLLDLLPTLAHYLGLDGRASWQGHDWLSSRPPPRARVLSETSEIGNWGGLGLPTATMVRDERYKLIANLSANLYELYDLRADPTEQRNIVDAAPAVFRRLRATLTAWQDLPRCRE